MQEITTLHPEAPPASSHLAARHGERTRHVTLFLALLGAVLVGIAIGHFSKRASVPGLNGGTARGELLKTGPWGEMERVPMTISAPVELLPVRALETTETHWFLQGATLESLPVVLQQSGFTPHEIAASTTPDRLTASPEGIDLRPPTEVLLSLAPAARLALFQQLYAAGQNESQFTFVPVAGLEERFRRHRVSPDTEARFRKMSSEYGHYLIFSGFSALLPTLADYGEKERLMKALTEQKTCLLRLHIQPGSDLESLARYWARGEWSSDIREIFNSLAHVEGSIWLDVVELLPPYFGGLLYTFPHGDNSLAVGSIRRDCHWTSFNFFRDPPDPKFGAAPSYVMEQLKSDYVSIAGDPRYGDLVLFLTPTGSVIHSAVFLADNVVYTKNGGTAIHPWMLSTLDDLLEQYAFMVKPGEKLTISYFRNKYN